jgi:ornithine carbamoyltransferase
VKDLLRTEHLTRAQVETLLVTAQEFAKDPLSASSALAGRTVAIFMNKPSTRTRLAAETAVAHLGGTPIFIRGDELQIGRGETISDTARVISQFASALIVRTFKQSDVDELGAAATIPVINGLTDDDHPTQLLADWLVLQEKFGNSIKDRKFVYIGDGNNMANTWLILGAIMGAHVVAITPSGKFSVSNSVVEKALQLAAASGAKIEVSNDPESVSGASAIYTDVWLSMGDSDAEKAERINALTPYSVTSKLMSKANSDAIFMHCLPAHRGEEVAAEVIDSERSVVWRQVFHRRTSIQSILYHLTRGDI